MLFNSYPHQSLLIRSLALLSIPVYLHDIPVLYQGQTDRVTGIFVILSCPYTNIQIRSIISNLPTNEIALIPETTQITLRFGMICHHQPSKGGNLCPN